MPDCLKVSHFNIVLLLYVGTNPRGNLTHGCRFRSSTLPLNVRLILSTIALIWPKIHSAEMQTYSAAFTVTVVNWDYSDNQWVYSNKQLNSWQTGNLPAFEIIYAAIRIATTLVTIWYKLRWHEVYHIYADYLTCCFTRWVQIVVPWI